jgi:hypothetical protein
MLTACLSDLYAETGSCEHWNLNRSFSVRTMSLVKALERTNHPRYHRSFKLGSQSKILTTE